jgi:hypothetical protein
MEIPEKLFLSSEGISSASIGGTEFANNVNTRQTRVFL